MLDTLNLMKAVYTSIIYKKIEHSILKMFSFSIGLRLITVVITTVGFSSDLTLAAVKPLIDSAVISINANNRQLNVELGQGCWPNQITNNGVALLVKPPAFSVMLKTGVRKNIVWHTQLHNSGSKTATGIGKIEEIPIAKWKRIFEDDGFIRCDFEFDKSLVVEVESLALEVFIASSEAKYFSHYLNYDYLSQAVDWASVTTSSGLLPINGTLNFTPLLWVGSSKYGLEVITETNENWINPVAMEPIDLDATNDSYRVRYSLITNSAKEEKTINRNLVYSFALFPTGGSIYDETDNPSEYAMSSSNIDDKFIHDMCGDDVEKIRFLNWSVMPIEHPGLPGSIDGLQSAYKQKLQSAVRSGSLPIVYTSLYIMPASHPLVNEAIFDLGGGARRHNRLWTELIGIKLPVQPVQLDDSKFREFIINEHLVAAQELGLSGVYIDAATPYIPSATVLVDDIEGGVGTSLRYPMFSHRQFVVDYHKVLKKNTPKFLIAHHAPQIPHFVRPYIDLVVVGEIWNRMFYRDDGTYVPDYSLLSSGLLAGFGNQTGTAKLVLLPQVLKKNTEYLKKNPDLYRKWTSTAVEFAAEHDLGLWHTRLDRKELVKIGSAKLLPCQ